jgi:hypothetical protein
VELLLLLLLLPSSANADPAVPLLLLLLLGLLLSALPLLPRAMPTAPSASLQQRSRNALPLLLWQLVLQLPGPAAPLLPAVALSRHGWW